MKRAVLIICLSVVAIAITYVTGYTLGRKRGYSIAVLQFSSLSPDLLKTMSSMTKAEFEEMRSDMRNMTRGAMNSMNLEIYTEAMLARRTLALHESGNHEQMASMLREKITKFIIEFEKGPFEAFAPSEAVHKSYMIMKRESEEPGATDQKGQAGE